MSTDKMKAPNLRIPEIDTMLRLGATKATPAIAVMGADVEDGNCASWSASRDATSSWDLAFGHDRYSDSVCCVGTNVRTWRRDTINRTTSVRPALPEAVAPSIRQSGVRADKFLETEYEGFGGGKPVANDIANDILNNFNELPETGKTYPVFNREKNKLENVPEILYKGEKYAVLTGQPCDKNYQIDGVEVEEGKKYVFKIEKLRVDSQGHFEYPMIVAPVELKFMRYYGDMDKTWMGEKVLPALAKSLVPSHVDEDMRKQSYLNPQEYEQAMDSSGAKLPQNVSSLANKLEQNHKDYSQAEALDAAGKKDKPMQPSLHQLKSKDSPSH